MLVDIHTHVLPGLDDGAPDMETALAMAEMAYEDGITHMILTPHYIRGSMENSRACVEKSISMLRKELMAREIKMEVFSGNEIFISIDTAELLENRNVCTLNGSSYVLVELPLGEIPHYTDRALFNLSLYGYRPIIAHPERNSEVIDNPGILRQFLEKKILLQVNATSLRGLYGGRVRDMAFELISTNMAHFVASDAHTISGRRPMLRKTYELVENKFGMDCAMRLFVKNGMAVIRNGDIQLQKPFMERNTGRSFLTPILNRLKSVL